MECVLRERAFEGETHIVTGAAQGIGNCVAQVLAAHGAQLVLVDLDPGRLAEAAQEIKTAGGLEPIAAAANVAEEVDVQRAVGIALEATGCINGVVNVAGITRDARIPKKSYEDFKAVMAVHLYGTFLFTREVAAQHWHLLFKKNDNQPLADGVNRFIVNFSSVSARNGNIGAVTRTTAREFASYRARVNAIAPGPVNTPMLEKIGTEGIQAMGRATLVGRIAEPVDIANTVCAIADPKLFGYTSGQVFAANGGMYMA